MGCPQEQGEDHDDPEAGNPEDVASHVPHLPTSKPITAGAGAALLRSGDYVQAEVDVAEVDAVADDVHTPVERDGVSAGAEVRLEESGGVECRSRPEEANLARGRGVGDVDDPQAVRVPAEVEGVAPDLRIVDGVETVGLVGQGVRGGEVAEPGRVCRVSEAPDAGEAPGIADELRLTCRLAVGGGEVLVGSHQQRAVLVGDGRVRVTLAAGRVDGSPNH